MNDHEAERIAAAAHQLRPDWPVSSVLTLIRKNLIDRPRRDVAVAIAWIACETNSHTPARVLEVGPWWRAAGIEGTGRTLNQVDRSARCTTCSQEHDKCRQLWADDHDFMSAVDAAKTKASADPESVRRVVEALKDEVAATPAHDKPKSRTLADLAERNPKLRARVDALRAAIPKDAPMREPEPPTTSPPPAAIPEQHLTRGTA